MDVRWAGDRSVYLAAGRAGTFELPLDSFDGFRPVIPGGTSQGSFWLSSRVAVSEDLLAVAAPVFSLRWKERKGGAEQEASFDAIVDLDVSGRQVLILGGRKDETGRFSPDGAIAWLGPLDASLSKLRAVSYDSSGPGARHMNACGALEIGTARFLRSPREGSFLIVPGVEPGAFLYDPQGKLTRTWDTREIGLDTEDCGRLSPAEEIRLSSQPEPRFAWLNQRRTVDEILPLPQGPGLVVRSVAQGQTRWVLKVLQNQGGIKVFDLPVPSRTELSHLRGDVRGNRIVFLVSEHGKDGPTAPPRLVLAEVPKAAG